MKDDTRSFTVNCFVSREGGWMISFTAPNGKRTPALPMDMLALELRSWMLVAASGYADDE